MKKMMTFILAVWSVLALQAQGFQEIKAFAESQKLDITTFAQLIQQQKQVQIIDARSADEFRINHLKGAIQVNVGDEKALQELIGRLDPKVYTFTYSIGAGRSVSLAKKLKDRGFQHVYFMPGGIGKWVGAGYPLESSIDPAKSLTLEGYQKQVASQHLTFVDISSKHCGGCKALHPILDNLEKQYPSVQVLRYELDENLKLVKDLKVKLLPTLLFYKDGQLVWTHDGIESEDNLQKLFQTYASR